MFPQPAGCRKYFPGFCEILKHRFLCYKNKQTFLIGKNVLIIMVPIVINKDVLEPSYDLKFIVQNYNYVCTNLISIPCALEKKKYILLLLGNVLFTCQVSFIDYWYVLCTC